MCTLWDITCTNSSYENMLDRRIAKKGKNFWNDLKRICGPLKMCSQAHKLQMCTLSDLAYTDSSYQTMQYRGIGKKMKNF